MELVQKLLYSQIVQIINEIEFDKISPISRGIVLYSESFKKIAKYLKCIKFYISMKGKGDQKY